MNHFDQKAWHLYVQGELSEAAAADMEHHLYACDLCMERFAACVERQFSSLPLPSDDFLERTMAGIYVKPAPVIIPAASKRHTGTDRSRTLRNYFIAAAATIVLTLTGAFTSLFEQVGHLQQQTVARDTSVSAKIVEQTATFLDDLQPKK